MGFLNPVSFPEVAARFHAPDPGVRWGIYFGCACPEWYGVTSTISSTPRPARDGNVGPI